MPIEGGQYCNVEAILRTSMLKLEQTKLLVIDWVENIYSCSSTIKTLKWVSKDRWLWQGGIVIKVYSKYIHMPLKHLHSIVGVLSVKEKLIQGNEVLKAWSVKSLNV
jgi:hypothetical protein